MNIYEAITAIRRRLEDIEELAKHLPEDRADELLKNMTRPSLAMQDWMDMNGVPKSHYVRFTLLRVAQLAAEGLTLEQIKAHRRVRSSRAAAPYIDEFFAKWSARQRCK